MTNHTEQTVKTELAAQLASVGYAGDLDKTYAAFAAEEQNAYSAKWGKRSEEQKFQNQFDYIDFWIISRFGGK